MSANAFGLSEPRDHTADALFAAYASAENIVKWAGENVRDAERGLTIAKLGEERAREIAKQAAEALRQHDAGKFAMALWLVKGERAA